MRIVLSLVRAVDLARFVDGRGRGVVVFGVVAVTLSSRRCSSAWLLLAGLLLQCCWRGALKLRERVCTNDAVTNGGNQTVNVSAAAVFTCPAAGNKL